MTSLLFLLCIFGCCMGQDLLPEGPVEGVLRKNVTFKTLVDLKDSTFTTFAWFFDRGNGLVPIVTVTPTGVTVAEGYQGRVQVNQTNGFLTLGPVKASDRGYYSASMVTPEMEKTGETMLRVLGCCKLHALPEGPVDVALGKTVTFKTLVDPREEIKTVAWFFISGTRLIRIAIVNEVPESIVFEDYKGRATVNITNGFLTLGPVDMKDNGDYHVNILTDTEAMKIGETQLRVLEPVSNVTIRANVTETVEFNSTVVLNCSATGSFLKFSWTNGTEPIVADNTQLANNEQEVSSSTLTISGVRSSDKVDPIYCAATNPLGEEKSAPFNLSVFCEHCSCCSAPPLSSTLTPPTQPGPQEEEETSSHTFTSTNATLSSQTTTPTYASKFSHTSPALHSTTTSSTTTTEENRDTRVDNQDFVDFQRAQFDKLQAELLEMRLSFERTIRQMESRTHSLLWSMSRRLERLIEAVDTDSASPQTKTYFSIRQLLPRGVSAVTPSSQPPGSRPIGPRIRGQRRRGG